MKQGFSQKIFNLEKNQAQQENMLNQIFNEIRNLKNPKATRKNNQNQSNNLESEEVDNTMARIVVGNIGGRRTAPHVKKGGKKKKK